MNFVEIHFPVPPVFFAYTFQSFPYETRVSLFKLSKTSSYTHPFAIISLMGTADSICKLQIKKKV